LTAHVLEAVDPASSILEFAAANHVDHIIIGARQNSLFRALLGSVSAKVAAEAPCTVTVVRPPPLASHKAETVEQDGASAVAGS
jgi:nucleotide-binding universal stress UspA family protein